ncbi:MAG: hypothetical protein EOP47_21935, partial [Sphingobacteriaceae bacterium]
MKNHYLLAAIILIMVSCKKDDKVQPQPAAKNTAPATTAVQRLVTYQTRGISRVTGKSIAGDGYFNPNSTDAKYNVGGTDLG